MVTGEIRKLYDSKFLWVIPDLHNLSVNSEFLCSPDFQYKESTFYLKTALFRSCKSESRCLIVYRIDTSGMNFASYSLSIVDRNGDDLRTIYSKDYGKLRFFHLDDLSLFSSLLLSLEFDPPSTGQPPTREEGDMEMKTDLYDSSSENSYIYDRTDVGTQTCSNLLPKPSLSSCSECVDNILKNFKKLLLSGQTSDVTFNVKGTEIKAHKAFLTAQSPVFGKMFDHDMVEGTTGNVEVTDCEPEDFHAFLLHLYTGTMEKLTVERALGLYCLADKYNVDKLGPYCVRFLISNLSVESFCDILSLGMQHCETDLIDSAISFFHENMKQIVGTPKWRAFNKENPDEATDVLMKALS